MLPASDRPGSPTGGGNFYLFKGASEEELRASLDLIKHLTAPDLAAEWSIATGYVGFIAAFVIAFAYLGIDLSQLALVAGALSVGIGFGLQSVVNNFVSGLILLAERPFKVGDWIVASGTEGNVRKISVRATEIETFQRQTVIMPNSLLINAAVGNWTHRNRLGRVDIPISVAYGNDPRRVHQFLVDVISQHPQALKNPAPSVSFSGFGAATLDFVIRAFVSDISSTLNLTNEIRFQIVEQAKVAGVAISSRDLADIGQS
jgi:potassium-dependent mechanosensitive channel